MEITLRDPTGTRSGQALKNIAKYAKINQNQAEVAELADARDSKSRDRKIMRVQLPPPAQLKSEVRPRFFYIKLFLQKS